MKVGKKFIIFILEKRGVVTVVFTWSGGGNSVYLAGSFTSWEKHPLPMERKGQDFSLIVVRNKFLDTKKLMSSFRNWKRESMNINSLWIQFGDMLQINLLQEILMEM
jgi:hypothetical protein